MNKNIKSQLKGILVPLMATTVALTGLAAGYGLWQDTIEVQVNTSSTIGDFTCFGFSQVTTDDAGPPINNPPPGGTKDHTVVSPIYYNGDGYRTFGYDQDGYPVPGEVAKDVGYTNGKKSQVEVGCGAKLVEVEVWNAYPSYASVTTVSFKNYGPDTAVVITAEGLGLPQEMTDAGFYLQYYSPAVAGVQHAKCSWLRKKAGPLTALPDPDNALGVNPPLDSNGLDDDGDGVVDEDPAVLDLCWENFEGETVQPGSFTAGMLKLHVLQPAQQTSVYKFYVWVEVWPA